MDLQGPDFSDSRDPIFSDSKDPMIIISDSSDLIFNSRDPNRVPKTPSKTLHLDAPTNTFASTAFFAEIVLSPPIRIT